LRLLDAAVSLELRKVLNFERNQYEQEKM